MNRPRIVFYNSVPVDGRIAITENGLLLFGDERWKSIDQPCGPGILERLMEELSPQATLEGSGSFVPRNQPAGDLPPASLPAADLLQDYLPENQMNIEGRRWFGVVEGRGRVRWMYKESPDEVWKGFYLLVLVCASTPLASLEYLRREEVPYLVAGETRVDLGRAFEKMKTMLGVETLLVTGGGHLGGALLRAGLLDEINIEFLPAIIGGTSAPVLFTAPDLGDDEMPTRLDLLDVQKSENGRVWLRYAVVK